MGRISNKVKLCNKLKQKSVEAFLLCVEIYNKPTISYRVEASSYLLCNAWELMLKGNYILKNGTKSIYRKDGKSFSLEEMIAKCYNQNSPIRTNLEYIIENIRNKSTHFIIKNHDILYMPLLQRAVLNYVDEIKNLFDIDISEIIPLESLTLMVKKEKKPTNLSKMYGKSFADSYIRDQNDLTAFIQSNIDEEQNCNVVAIVQSNLAWVKDSKKADILAYYDPSGKALKEIIVPKDVNSSHPYSMKQALDRIKEILKDEYKFEGLHNNALVQYNKENNILANEKYFKEIKYGVSEIRKYSKAYVEKIVSEIRTNSGIFKSTKL